MAEWEQTRSASAVLASCADYWSPEPQGAPDQHMARLVRTIEGEIIPRLMLAHRVNGELPGGRRRAAGPTQEEVAELARIVVSHDVSVACAYVEAMRAREIPVERLYLELLAPVARLLGKLWIADRCTFTDVTIGLLRLQQVMHELSPNFHAEAERERIGGYRALLVPVPGEQHVFGVGIVAEFFRRAGWEIWDEAPRTERGLLELVRAQSFSLIGLSASVDSRLHDIAKTIRNLRRASCNHSVGILVGGLAFLGYPERVTRVGADGSATDGRQAVRRGQELVTKVASVP